MAYNVTEGTALQFYTIQPFTDINGSPVDPDLVQFVYQVQNQDQVIFTYGVDADLVRVGTGEYRIKISTSGLPGEWVYSWIGEPVVGGADITHTAVVWEGRVTVSPRSIQQ